MSASTNTMSRGVSDSPPGACWELWEAPGDHPIPTEKAIDKLFGDWLFYPEIEWTLFGLRPPEGCPVLGAWRTPEHSAFAFLVLHRFSLDAKEGRRMLLYVTGDQAALRSLERPIDALKSQLRKASRRELIQKSL